MPSALGAASVPFIGCVALLAAEVLTVLSFASPYWAKVDGVSWGLWRKALCDPGCTRWNMHWDGEDWQLATRGLESLAIIFFVVPLIVLPVYIYVALGLYYRCTLGLMTLFAFLGTVCNVAGVVVFGVQIGSHASWDLDWCLVVCVIGGALGLIAAIVLLIATINKPEFSPHKYFSSGFYVDPDKNRLYVVESDDPVKMVYAPSEPPHATPAATADPAPAPAPASVRVVGPVAAGSGSTAPAPVSAGQVNPVLVVDE